ncbi:kinesin-like protein KIN-14U isoform X2 [Rhodamnia argentea]|uniref:Kinesin-like protein KIN-14U isoform X2 n=1 Tax=Rhodamnia argentea TaxID=178133 RepID=A0A8B8NE83_9MYRT|nr:kinesin-like protein KIN-14U isoform X2 [Rhodamnia argentea]
MLISSGKEEHASLPVDDLRPPLKPPPMGLNSDSLDGYPPATESSDSPPLIHGYTDVTVVPEHEKHELEQTISNLEGEILQLRQKQKLLDEKRREALNNIIDIKGSIRVFCRVRPFLPRNRRKNINPISTGLDKMVVKLSGGAKEFEFDKLFQQESSQEDIFAEVEPILTSALDGHNVCVLAYGQTGTGKTYTMDGVNDKPGIVPRALEKLFSHASRDKSSSLTFSMSMLEVYMGNLRDLLAPKPICRAYETSARCNLSIQTDLKGLVEVEGLMEVQIPDLGKAKWWYNKGRRSRSTSWTNVNETSSRSHCLTRISIVRKWDSDAKTESSKLWMVDLGGSERLLKTGAIGQTLDEGRAINLSLSALGDVIAALRRKRGHVPYRNSKLTQILKDSLGDGSKVLMLAHVSPCEEDVAETVCSLSFATRARAVESIREIPEDLKKLREKKLADLEKHMKEAEKESQIVTDQLLKAEFLLSENKKLFSSTYDLVEDVEKTTSPKDLEEVLGTPPTSVKVIKPTISNSLPRFMTSTVASRQRQSASERDIVGRTKSWRSATRSSIQFSHSQSFGYSDPHLKAMLEKSTKKSRYAEPKGLPTESPKCIGSDSKPTSLLRSKMVTSSDPNVRATLARHRRRMSNLI